MASAGDRYAAMFSTIDMYNRDETTMPFALIESNSDAKVMWRCGHDAEGRIVSFFRNEETSEVAFSNQVTYERALEMRQELLDNGWKKFVPPKTEFKMPGESKPRQMNRKERRRYSRKIEQLVRQNPFKSDRATASTAPPSSLPSGNSTTVTSRVPFEIPSTGLTGGLEPPLPEGTDEVLEEMLEKVDEST